jgi:Domain of unknown function (DUF4277)
MDHYGLVAGVCRNLKIAEIINQRIGSKDPRRVVQPGIDYVALILMLWNPKYFAVGLSGSACSFENNQHPQQRKWLKFMA